MAATVRLLELFLVVLAIGAQAKVNSEVDAGSEAKQLPKQDLSPPVDSEHEHFFGKDYPHDKQPRVPDGLKFDHPYPEVQEPDTFDLDYPKDENDDDGEWKAQMDYDTAKNILRKRQEATKRAREEKEAAEKDLDFAKRNAAQSDEAVRKADHSISDAERSVHDAEAEEQEANASVGEVAQTVEQAMKEVERRSKYLEGCEEQLARAKAVLEKILAAREADERERVQKAIQAREALRKARAEVKALEEAKKSNEERDKALEAQIQTQAEAQAVASQQLDEVAAGESKAEEDLHTAANKLRQFRASDAAAAEKAHVAESGASPTALFTSAVLISLASLTVLSL